MTSPWQTMPDFTDGTVVDEGDLDPIVANLNLVRRSSRVLAGRIITTAAAHYTTAGTTELNMPKLQISNIPIEANRSYFFGMTLYCQGTAAGDVFHFRVRQNTGLTGAELTLAPVMIGPTPLRDIVYTMLMPWKPNVGGTTTFYVSVQRPVAGGGTGTCTIYGHNKTSFWLEKAGDDGTEWALIP